MANPQQPELRRSEQVPALSPDAVEDEIEARDRPGNESHPLVEAPSSPEGTDEDKPDLDDVAEQLGTKTD